MAKKAATSAEPVRTVPATFVLVLALLVIAAGAALMLVIDGLGGMPLPGCGPESGCARAASSVFGKVPGIEWIKTSDVGLAYFISLILAWVITRGRLPDALRWLVRLGGIASIAFIAVMLVGKYFCVYCITIHAANLAFTVLLEARAGRAGAARRAIVPAGGAFIVVAAVLAVLQFRHVSAAREQDEIDRRASARSIIDRGTRQDPPPTTDGDGNGAEDEAGFTGRWRIGPEAAPIRVVIISDFQCPDCRDIEEQMREIFAERSDISVSAKHFPFCVDCNRYARSRNFNPHPNACWAARASEAAGILGGNDGFWRMHRWLFDRQGSFTAPELRAALPGLGFDYDQFAATMQGDETLRRVQEDVEEGLSLGLYFTPMIFINGVELKGWRRKGRLAQTINEVAATNPPPRTAAADRPPDSLQKHVDDWQEQPVRRLPEDASEWMLGSGGDDVRVVIWGDYQEPYTAELDVRIRAAVEAMPGTRYVFRHYPFDKSCNDNITATKHPLACRASQAAEAAGRLGGNAAYWRMHAWLMENRARFSDETLRAAARQMGLDPEALFAAMASPEVAAAIQDDIAAGKRTGLRGIPHLFINEKQVPRWRLEGERVPEKIMETARDEAAAGAGAG